MSDVRDILELENIQEAVSIDNIINDQRKQKKRKLDVGSSKRPEGMHRELYALLFSDNKDAPPILPTDTGIQTGYKQMKANLGIRKVRPWKWMPFTNPARKDTLALHHWRRIADEGKDYPFSKFNKMSPVPSYTDSEYATHLQCDSWTKVETDNLFDLCRRFDLRFVVIHDRWDLGQFSPRSVEELKERYYNICNILTKVKAQSTSDSKVKVYDAEHEKRRKEQLRRLFGRTQEQIEEEQTLVNEMKKIELRKKERDKKTQDLQKLITAADSNSESRKHDRKQTKKKIHLQKSAKTDFTLDMTGIKFADFKSSGASLRSQRMKLPAAVGQKKSKAIEALLPELGVALNPIPTDEICTHFNELRSDMVLLYELKQAYLNCQFELETLHHQYEALAPGKPLDLPANLSTPCGTSLGSTESTPESPVKQKPISEMMDFGASPTTSNRKKRQAAIEQGNILKKIKKL